MKQIFIFLLLIPVGISCHSQQKQNMEAAKYYQLIVQSNVVSYSIEVNGVEQCSFTGGTSRSFATEVNQWLVRGKNTVRIRYTHPPDALNHQKDAWIDVKLYWARPGDEAQTPERTQVDYNWAAKSDDLYPQVYTQPFELPDFPETLLAKAETFTIDESNDDPELTQNDKQEILAQVHSLTAAYLGHDVETVYNLQKNSIEDVARSRYRDAYWLNKQKQGFEERLTELGKLEYKDPQSSFRFRVMGGNKIVHVCRIGPESPDYTLAFVYKDEDTTREFFVDLYFAKINGQWIIIR